MKLKSVYRLLLSPDTFVCVTKKDNTHIWYYFIETKVEIHATIEVFERLYIYDRGATLLYGK